MIQCPLEALGPDRTLTTERERFVGWVVGIIVRIAWRDEKIKWVAKTRSLEYVILPPMYGRYGNDGHSGVCTRLVDESPGS